MIYGIDEVGRGAWAGPLVVGAVTLHAPIPGLRDSKQLSASKRDELAGIIYEYGTVYICNVEAPLIDAHGLGSALSTAFARAAAQCTDASRIILDGAINYAPLVSGSEAVIRADTLYDEVMAAAIVAKVWRDKYMSSLAIDPVYAPYEFQAHKGYGTQLHRDRLERYGASAEHRLSVKPVRLCAQMHGQTKRMV